MLPKTVRGAVAAAAVLVEEVGKRVVGTAAGLLEKGGIDVAEVERRLGGQFPPSAQSLQTLADEALTAGRAGVDMAVGVARGEVEKVFEKVGDQVTKVGVVLAYLESKLREVEDEEAQAERAGFAPAAPAPRAGGLFEDGWEQETKGSAEAERIAVDEPVEVDPPVPPNGTAVAAPAPATAPAPENPAPEKKAAVRKPAAAKKTAAAGKPAAKKTAVKKTAVKKTSTAKGTASGRKATEAGPDQPPAKRTATRKTTVRRTSTTKKPDA
ncbi:hypothetical protein ACFP3U_34510 [Kitasatospora misakiensis]|uniref:Uncharacterized protein n=1 Tax=Kitasatospora misakiensis TaxID=67330 RepID=A0ABW0XIW2_9ACTN